MTKQATNTSSKQIREQRLITALMALGALAVVAGVGLSASAANAEPVSAAVLPGVSGDCWDPASPSYPCDVTPTPTLPTPPQKQPVKGVLTLTKTPYLNVTDKSSVEAIEATGTRILENTALPVGTEVCFVYTVTNNTAGAVNETIWTGNLTDDDVRLGDNGVFDSPGVMTAAGDKWKQFDCTTLIYFVAQRD